LNQVGYSEPSNEVTVTTPAGLSAPQNLANNPAVTNSGIIGITWSAPSTNGGSPVIDYCVTNVSLGTTHEGITSTSYTAANLPNWHSFAFKVKARNADGFGPDSDYVTIIPAAVPSAPQNLQYEPVNSSSETIAFTWLEPTTNGGNPI